MSDSIPSPLHMIDILRKKRDGGALDEREIQFVARGAADGSIPGDQLAAWLMASWIRGLSRDETRALTLAMRDSGVRFTPKNLGRRTVDKHSSGGGQDQFSGGAAGGGVRRGCAHDQRARAGAHRRDTG
jgi:thymidine phosphorylase